MNTDTSSLQHDTIWPEIEYKAVTPKFNATLTLPSDHLGY